MNKPLLFLLIFVSLAGCGRIPEPVGYEFSEQRKMQAAYHWHVLAGDVANRINNRLILSDFAQVPVYVRDTCGDENTPCQPYQATTFNEAFRDLLITELVHFGVPVKQQQAEEAITVHYKVQVVYHASRRIRTLRPGAISSLTTAILVLRDAPSELITLAAAGVADIANQTMLTEGHYEVIITTSMIQGGHYLYRGSDIYYINDKDFYQYQSVLPQAAEIPLIAPPVAQPVSAGEQKQVHLTGGQSPTQGI